MIKISKIEYYLPEYVLTNEDLEKEFPEWSSDRIKEKVGITERHVAAENETVLDLAIQSSKKLFESYDKNKIDFILFVHKVLITFYPLRPVFYRINLG